MQAWGPPTQAGVDPAVEGRGYDQGEEEQQKECHDRVGPPPGGARPFFHAELHVYVDDVVVEWLQFRERHDGHGHADGQEDVGGDDSEGRPPGHPLTQRVDDEAEAVDGDDQDAGGRDVHGDGEGGEDDPAEDAAEDPPVGQLVVQLDREAVGNEEEVGQGQVGDENVRDGSKAPPSRHQEDDRHVEDTTDQDDDDVDDDDDRPNDRIVDQVDRHPVGYRLEVRPVVQFRRLHVQPEQIFVRDRVQSTFLRVR